MEANSLIRVPERPSSVTSRLLWQDPTSPAPDPKHAPVVVGELFAGGREVGPEPPVELAADALVLPFEVRVLIVEGQGGELSLAEAQGGGEKPQPDDGLAVQPDLTPDLVLIEVVQDAPDPLSRCSVKRAGPGDVLTRRHELLGGGGDRVLDAPCNLYPAPVAHLVLGALAGEEVAG